MVHWFLIVCAFSSATVCRVYDLGPVSRQGCEVLAANTVSASSGYGRARCVAVR